MLTEHSSKAKCWLIFLGNLCSILNILKRKEAFADRALDNQQEHIDEWAGNWVVVNGREGCTNNTHMVTCHTVLFCESGGYCIGTAPTRDGSTKTSGSTICTTTTLRGVERMVQKANGARKKTIGSWYLIIMYWTVNDKSY
jgi:hypothetical protein